MPNQRAGFLDNSTEFIGEYAGLLRRNSQGRVILPANLMDFAPVNLRPAVCSPRSVEIENDFQFC